MLKNLFTSKITRKKLDSLISAYQSDKKTLEIGSWGNPRYGRFFSNKTGIDVRAGAGVDVVASVYSIPFKDAAFDIVLCISVLEHLEEPAKAIEEMKRVLKPGGKIIVSVPFMYPIHESPGDYWRFTKFGLKSLFKDWETEKIIAETNTQEAFAVLFQRLVFQTKMRMDKLSKGFFLALAYGIEKMPNITKKVFGDIKKSTVEPEAFTSAFFGVFRKI